MLEAKSRVMSEKARAYLQGVAAEASTMSPAKLADRITSLAGRHDDWRATECLNLNPAETLISRSARRLLDSDLATRVTEGYPGDKYYPHGRQNDFIDEIEGILIGTARDLFDADYVEWRPVSTSMANASVYFALLEPGDRIMAHDADHGGNDSYNLEGPPHLARLEVAPLPQLDSFRIDVDALRGAVMERRPRLIVVGASNVLFPYPLEAIRDIADTVGALVLYDAAHLGLLIATKDFQDPLREGAHIVTVSTHKNLCGPVGGMILTNEAELGEKLMALQYPTFVQTRDLNKYAAAAVSFLEMKAYGAEYSQQMIKNAQALGDALSDVGFSLYGSAEGYTRTHQLMLDLREGDPPSFENRLLESNILLTLTHVRGDEKRGFRTASRIATHEITRQGMKESHMETVAGLLRAASDGIPTDRTRSEIKELLESLPALQYSFDTP
jgi:glycine hydroxymethyltransferase